MRYRFFRLQFAGSDSIKDDQKLPSDRCSVTSVTLVLICLIPLGPGLHSIMTATSINWPLSLRGHRDRIFTPRGRAVCRGNFVPLPPGPVLCIEDFIL